MGEKLTKKELEQKLAEAEKLNAAKEGYIKELQQRLESMPTPDGYGYEKSVYEEKLRIAVRALEAWLEWEDEQIKREGPYAGSYINVLIKNGKEALNKIKQ